MDKMMYNGFTEDLLKNKVDPSKYKKISKKEY